MDADLHSKITADWEAPSTHGSIVFAWLQELLYGCLALPPLAPFTIDTVDTSTIVILDFGSQYTQLIARRIREFNVFSVVLPCTAPIEQIRALNPLGLILSGGPMLGLRRGRARRRPCAACDGRSRARHLLRAALHRASPGRAD